MSADRREEIARLLAKWDGYPAPCGPYPNRADAILAIVNRTSEGDRETATKIAMMFPISWEHRSQAGSIEFVMKELAAAREQDRREAERSAIFETGKRAAAARDAEWVGYVNGLTYAANLRSRFVIDDSGGRVLNDIRAQIVAEIENTRERVAAAVEGKAGK